MEFLVGVLSDALENIGEPSLSIDIVEPGCSYEGVHNSGPVAAAV